MSYGTSRPTGVVRLLVGAIASAAFVGATAAPAGAHTALEASSPKDGGSISVAPSRLVLKFSAPILSVGYRIIVVGPDNNAYQTVAPQITSPTLSQPLKPLGPTGEYRVEFRVVAYDGHPLTGGIRFTLTKPGPAAGGSKAVALIPLSYVSTSVNNAPPSAPWIGGAVAMILLSGGVFFGRRVTRGLD